MLQQACKNKTVEVLVNRNPSAFSHHQEQAATAEREIQISSGTNDQGVLSHFPMNQSHTFPRQLNRIRFKYWSYLVFLK